MSRTFTGPQRTLLASKQYDFHARASVQKDDKTWQDFSNFLGYDWLESARWSDNAEQPTMEGSITFGREHDDGGTFLLSLAPYMKTSPLNANASFLYSPAIKGGRGVVIWIAYTAKGVSPVFSDWIEVFTGYIHNPEWGGEDSVVTCAMRDIFGYLMAQWIEGPLTVGDPAGMAYEAVLQQILDANPSNILGAVQLYTPVSPLTNLKEVIIDSKPVLLALRDLAAEIGHDVKGRYDSAGRFRLTFFKVDRAKTTPDYTISPAEVFAIESMDWPTDDIRNKILVEGRDGTTGLKITSLAEDAQSQLDFGTKFMKTVEDAAGNLNTQAELDNLSGAMLSDLSRPFATQRMRTPFFWIAQPGDLIGVLPNDRWNDEQINLCPMQIDYSIERGDGDSVIYGRERVAGYVKEWIKKGIDGPVDPQAPTISARNTVDATWLGYIWLTPHSPTGEKMSVWMNDNGFNGFPPGTELWMCASNVDPTMVFVDSDTEINAADGWFTDGTSIILGTNTIPLILGITFTFSFQARGQQSDLRSAWLPVVLTYDAPTVQSASLGLLRTPSDFLRLVLTAGQNMRSAYIEIRSSAVIGGGTLLHSGTFDVATGASLSLDYVLTAPQALITWYAHIRPRALNTAGGILSAVGTTIIVQQGTAYAAPSYADIDNPQALVSATTPANPSARVVADDPTVAWDFSVTGVAKAAVPNLGITTAKIGNSAVTPAKLAPGASTPGATNFYRGDGKWVQVEGALNIRASNGSSVLLAGDSLPVYVRDAITLIGPAVITADQSGSFTMEFYMYAPGSVAAPTKISASAPVTLAATREGTSALTGWTVAIPADRWVFGRLTGSPTSVTKAVVAIPYVRT